MTNLENVSREGLENALGEVRKDIVRVSGIMGIVSGDSDFWLIILTLIGLTHLIQVNWNMGLGSSILISGGIVCSLYLLRHFESQRQARRLEKEPLGVDTDVDLS